ncbi:MAG: site-specific integrase [Thaumarchaeota archaeon]|nr:site-specific integrase [Nitrososphaerota archaeon]
MILEQKRTQRSYYEKIQKHSLNSQKGTKNALNNFDKFCKEKYDQNIEEIVDDLVLVKKQETVFDILQSWINWNKIAPSSLKTYFIRLNTFLHYKGIKLDARDVKSELIFPKVLEEELYPLQVEDIGKILSAANYDKRGMYLAQISSGMRLGEIVQIRKKDLVLDSKRIMVKIPAKITKTKQARTTFLSTEAEKMIRHKLKKLDDDDLVWGNNPIPINNEIAEIANLHRYLGKCGLDMKYDSGQYKINTHSFRAFFITKMSRHDPNFAKKLAGQKGYLLQYDRMTDNEKLDKYLEFEKDLIIDPTERQKARISDLEKNEERIAKLEERQEITASLVTSISDNVHDKIFDYKNMDSDQLHLMADLISLKINTIPGFKKAFEKVIGVNLEEYAQRKKKKTLS